MVLAPIDPVAPRIVMARTSGAATGPERKIGTALVIATPNPFSPHQQSARGSREPAARDCDHCRDHGGRHEAIEAVHDAAMAGNDMARVLDAEPPFDRRFEQVAGLRDRGEYQGERAD